jgi:hypothetical protein
MGRTTDIDNIDDEQQTTLLSTQMEHESQSNPDDDDPLIHDTILPHRKRIRRDTLLSIQHQQQYYVQPQQITFSKIEDVSLF